MTFLLNCGKASSWLSQARNVSRFPFASFVVSTIKMSKRKLGLGKVRAKKQKLDIEEKNDGGVITKKDAEKHPQENENSDEKLLTVELADEVNPLDPLSQLCGLWKTWKDGDRNNELILNGIINECDRILRNTVENGGDEDVKLNDEFYSIYGQALCDISKFKPDEEVKDWIDNSIDRIEEGFNKFGKDNIRLKFAKCYILLNRIATQYIAQMNVDSKKDEFKGLKALFQEFIDTWNEAVAEAENQKAFSIFGEEWVLEILNIFDDLLDIIDKFGTQMSEVVDSDEEEAEEEEEEEREKTEGKMASRTDKSVEASDALRDSDFQISEEHPLYEIQNDDSYNCFWRDNMLKYRDLMGQNVDKKIRRSVHEKLGQSYLMEAEEPIAFFNSYQYDQEEDNDDDPETTEAAAKACAVAQDLVNNAIEQLREAYDEEDPKTWVNVAEALITYGNLLELESEEQEKSYKEAEKLLRRANNACHGRYQDILDSLVQT